MPEAAKAPETPFWVWAVYVVYCIEMSVILALLPWSSYWENNFFLRAHPALMAVGVSGYARGAVTALGVVLCYMGLEGLIRRALKTRVSARP